MRNFLPVSCQVIADPGSKVSLINVHKVTASCVPTQTLLVRVAEFHKVKKPGTQVSPYAAMIQKARQDSHTGFWRCLGS